MSILGENWTDTQNRGVCEYYLEGLGTQYVGNLWIKLLARIVQQPANIA